MIHRFLRSIGFSDLKRNEDLYDILEETVHHPDAEGMMEDSNGNDFACFAKYVTGDAGIAVYGNFIRENEFRMEYYFPFLRGLRSTVFEPVEYERHAGEESYLGVCDDVMLGEPLIFHVINVDDLLRDGADANGIPMAETDHVLISGLALSGKIVLPMAKNSQAAAMQSKTFQERKALIRQVREGSPDAMEHLTLNDMDTYATVSRRALREDVLSIVDTSLIPDGMECDQYTVIGEIEKCKQEQNQITGEKIWYMTLICNEVHFDVCINEKDLLGEPAPGRRFKGRIWLQGYVYLRGGEWEKWEGEELEMYRERGKRNEET